MKINNQIKEKIIAQNTEGKGLLPMKQSGDLEAGKSEQQKSNELCNFLKNAFVVDGKVQMIEGNADMNTPIYFLLEDSERGIIKLAFENIK
jgi:hypothetical protein